MTHERSRFGVLLPFAGAAALEGYDLAAHGKLLDTALWKLLGDAKEALAPLHFGPHFLGMHPRGDPQHNEIVEEIGTLPHDRLGMPVHRVDHYFDGFLGKLFGHFVAAGTEQARGARSGRIRRLGGTDGLIESIERITHA